MVAAIVTKLPQAVMPLGYPTPVNGGELLIPALAKTIEPVRRAVCSDLSAAASELMTTGGDQRIVLNPETGLNQYMVAPRPSTMTAYSSSTANDISGPAFSEVTRRLAALAPDLQLSPGPMATHLMDCASASAAPGPCLLRSTSLLQVLELIWNMSDWLLPTAARWGF
ncbi:MAG: hypothetical protein IPI83_07485 [Sphingomonadales bacterium]|nr:hypothetical protein [Sphingomonadales bacterium]